MPRTRTISPELLKQAQLALKNLPDSKVQFRLLAIVKTAEKGFKAVADFFEVHTNTLSRWVTQFEKSGLEGLKEKPKGHRPAKLSDQQLQILCQWIETEQNARGEWVHWTLEKLRYAIQDQWDISIAVGPLWRQLKLKGYSHKSVRPKHTNQPDEAEVEAFKKTSNRWSALS
jgi:transposase